MVKGDCLLTLGDSITQADAYHASWRYPLWKAMVDEGMNYSWVGSMTEHAGGKPSSRLHRDYRGLRFPTRHEGHGSWTIDDILHNVEDRGTTGSGNIQQWLEEYECMPTCTLIHL